MVGVSKLLWRGLPAAFDELHNDQEGCRMLRLDSPKMSSAVLKAYLAEKLRDAIVSRKYSSGDRLNETSLALHFNVSRVAVREALMRLQQQGLVMNHPRRGMFVNDLSAIDAQKINSIRIPLEAEALRLCRQHLNKQMVKHLDSLVTRMERWRLSSQFETAEMDLEFHRAVWIYSNNPYLAKALDSLVPILFAHRAIDAINDEQARWRLSHHRQLLDVIEGTSAQSAEQAILAHLRMGYDDPERFSSLAMQTSKPAASKRTQRRKGAGTTPPAERRTRRVGRGDSS